MEYITAAETAKRIRAALKEAFPGFKFSVRSDNYSGGSSVDIGWTDGPTDAAVSTITKRHEDVSRDQFGDILSGGNRFVFTHRECSPELRARALAQYEAEYGIQGFNPDKAEYTDYCRYHRMLAEMEGPMPAAPAKASKPTTRAKPTSAPSATVTPSQTATEPAATFTCNKWCSWLMFASKPARAVVDALKTEGWRWSEKRQGYYTQERKNPPECVGYQQTA